MSKSKATPAERRVARYESLCATIERWQRRLDKADRTVQRAVRMIAKLERQRKRAKAAIDKGEVTLTVTRDSDGALLFHGPAPDATPAPKPKRAKAADEVRADPVEVRRILDAAIDSTPAPKPKRKRRTPEDVRRELDARATPAPQSPGK